METGWGREIYDDGLVASSASSTTRSTPRPPAPTAGRPASPTTTILHRLVALNRERAAEEAQGLVRWLRPEFQNPDGRAAAPASTPELALGETAAAAAAKPDWPRLLPEQIAAVRAALADAGEAAPADIARRFRRARAASVAPLLETLAALGHARLTADGRFTA